jgi:hypothetical protein
MGIRLPPSPMPSPPGLCRRRQSSSRSARCEVHLLERGAAEQVVGVSKSLGRLEVIIALKDNQLNRLARTVDKQTNVSDGLAPIVKAVKI